MSTKKFLLSRWIGFSWVFTIAMRKSISLKAVLALGENTGDTSGSPTFQGGPWGMGKHHQLAVNNPSKNLVDPQEEEEKHVYGSLDGEYDDHPHMQPIPDDTHSIEERSEGDALYRDLPGYPRMNALVAPQNFMPKGLTGEPKRDTSNMRLSLTPPGNGEKEEWFGVGPFDGSKARLVLIDSEDQLDRILQTH